MEQYISKSAVVAEIDKVMAEEMKFYETACKEGDEEVSSSPMVYTRLQILRSYIDSLEMKEVDLKKAVEDHIYTHDGRKRMELELDWEQCDLTLKGGDAIIKFAKHFFELGLKAQKGK